MKKRLSLALSLILSLSMLAGCGGGDDAKTTTPADTSASVTTPAVPEDDGDTDSDTGGEYTVLDGGEEDTPPAETEPPIEAVEQQAAEKYAYNLLSEKEREYYDILLDGAKNFKTIILLDGCSRETYSKVFTTLVYQEPQLFYVRKTVDYYNEIGYIDYLYTREEAAAMQAEIDSVVADILANAGDTPYDKLLYFHDWLIKNNDFSLDGAEAATIYSAFVTGKSQCFGYASAVQYLCNAAGIECITVCGKSDTDSSHAWNKIRLDGEWYNLDVTWDDPYSSSGDLPADFIKHQHFLVTDDEINDLTHFKVNRNINDDSILLFEVPAATGTKYNYNRMNGTLVSSVEEARQALTRQAADGEKYVSVKCSDRETFEAVVNAAVTEGSAFIGTNKQITIVRDTRDTTYYVQLNLI